MTSRRFSRVLWFCVVATLGLGGVVVFVPQARTLGQVPVATIAPSHGRPLVQLRNPQGLRIDYNGSADGVAALKAGATGTTLAVGDFDADGAPDLVSGYKSARGGIVTLLRGNPDAFAPRDPTLYPAAIKGKVPPTFLNEATAYAVPASPDFLAVGDFDRDGYRDLLVGTNGGGLYLLAGDGKGKLGAPQAVPLSGPVRTMDVSDGGYVAVSLEGPEGLRVAILAPGPHGLTEVGSYPTPGPATSLAWGSLGGGLDLAVGAGNNVMLIYGPLGSNPETETVTLPVSVQALAVGDYIWDRDGRQEIAVLGSDGAVRILQHGSLDTRPLTAADIPGRRAALRARPSEMRSPMAMGPWTVAKQLPATGATPAGPASRSTFSSPRLAAARTQDLMLLDAGKTQVTLLDTSGKAANATATIAFSGTPVAAVALPQKINGGRDLVVLTSSAVEPIVTEDAPDPTYDVNTTADIDTVGACAQNSTVTSSAGTLSLREAVCEANNSGAATSVINLPAGTYDLAISTFGGNDSASSSPELQVGIQSGNNITISGAGAGSTIIQQTASGSRIIEADQELAGNEPLAVQNLSLQLGNCTDSGLDCLDNGGGAILAGGATGDTLTITNVTFNDNTTQSAAGTLGGAVEYTGSLLSISGSTFTQNTASGTGGAQGGALQVEDVINGSEVSGSVTITNSSFTGNSAISGNNGNANGGGLYFEGGASFNASVTGSTFTGNTASSTASTGAATGGGIEAEGGGTDTFSVSNSRIVGNSVSASSAVASGYYAVGLTNTLTNNWWGCNGGPGASGCDTVVFDFASGGSGTFNPWLVLSITAGSTQVDASGTTGLTADLTHNSAAAGGFSVPTGTPVTFGGTLDSSVNPSSTTLTSGTATSTYTAGSTAGAGSGTATVDNQTASVTIDVVGGTTTSAAVDDAGTSSPWSGTEVAGASAYGTASVTPGGGGPTPTGTVTYTFYTGGSCSSSSGTSTVTLSSGVAPKSSNFGPLAAGAYSLSASYSGNSDYQGSSSNCQSFIVNKAQPATSVTSNQNPSNYGQSVTLTAVVSGGYSPTGSVEFTSNSAPIAGCTAVILSSGQAQCMTTSLAPGTDTIAATNSGDANNNSSTGTLSGGQQVGTITPTVTVTPGQSSINSSQSLSVTVAVSGGGGNPTPTGSVTLSSGSYTSSATPLSAGSATITVPAGSLAVGNDTLTATYTPDAGSSSTYASAIGTAPVAVSQAIGSCTTANPNPNPNPVSFAAVGDFNGDCRSDILWRNSGTEQVYEWLMDGTTFTSSGSPGSLTSDWVIQGSGDF
ncbi:MAG: Ig-like domain repeat protein, partial [Acidobacteriaceae bacterium]